MKPFLFLAALLLTLPGISQNRVGINEIQLSTSKGEQPAFEFFVPDATADQVLDAWVKFHKPLKAKPKQEKDQRNYYFTDNAFIPDLSENTIDIYTRIYETSGGVRFACAFDLGGVFISSKKTSDKFTKAKLLLNKFYAEMAMDAIIAQIETELKELQAIKAEYNAIDQEIKSFETQAKGLDKKMNEQQALHEEAERNLNTRTSELADVREELTEKKAELASINKETLVANLSQFSADLKKVTLETDKIEKDVKRKEAEIATIEAEIKILKNDLVGKKVYSQELESKIQAIEDQMVEFRVQEKEEHVQLLEQNVKKIESIRADLSTKKSNYRKSLESQQAQLDKINNAIAISRETRELVQKKITDQEAKLKELEELKATIE